MRTASRIAVAMILFLPVTGCRHKQKAAPPQQAQAPPAPASSMAHIPSLPALPPPPSPDVAVATAKQPQSHEPVRPRKSSHHRQAKPTAAETANTPSPEKTQAANGVAAGISPIGQLSSTGESASSGRHDIEELINNTEKGLNGIGRTLNSNEQLTATQIRTFLAKAKQALGDNDLDGAQTLATKAKVLLEELTRK